MLARSLLGTLAGSGVLSFALACSSPKEEVKVVCMVSAPTMCPDPAPVYADVAPIFEARCASCHSGIAGGPWPLKDYEHISDWRDVVRAELVNCSMPPADAPVPLSDEDRLQILNWLRCGLPK